MEQYVTFSSAGSRIVGALHLPDTRPPWPGAVFCHGFTGHKAESHFLFTRMARSLARAGCAVLRFDFRGSGDSEGDFADMTIPGEVEDAKAAIAFLCRRRGVDTTGITLVGLSMGGLVSVHAATDPRVRRLALLSAVFYPNRLRRFLTRRLLRQIRQRGSAYIPGMGLRIGREFIETAGSLDARKAAEAFTGSVLIVHAKDDASVPLDHSLAYFEAFHTQASSCELMVLADGGHTYTTEAAEQSVIEAVTEFAAMKP